MVLVCVEELTVCTCRINPDLTKGDLTSALNRPFVPDVGPRALVSVEEPRLLAPSLARALGMTTAVGPRVATTLGWRRDVDFVDQTPEPLARPLA